jgi:glyoxylase-like metal-dependent hydrolase (beta-lactamase superfamily II)
MRVSLIITSRKNVEGAARLLSRQYRVGFDVEVWSEQIFKDWRSACLVELNVHRNVSASYCLHESADVSFQFAPLKDQQEIELGNTRMKVLHTPGHTPESICLVVTDLRRGVDPWFVLTGDTLFVGAVGRPDLPGRARENAAELHESIHNKLLALPDPIVRVAIIATAELPGGRPEQR